MDELTDQDKKDILRRKNLGQEIDPPQSYENVPMCKCGSLDMTWNSDGTYECRKCNGIIRKSDMEKLNYPEYHEQVLAKHIKSIQDEEDVGTIFIMG